MKNMIKLQEILSYGKKSDILIMSDSNCSNHNTRPAHYYYLLSVFNKQ